MSTCSTLTAPASSDLDQCARSRLSFVLCLIQIKSLGATHLWGEKIDQATMQRYLHRYRRWMVEEAAVLRDQRTGLAVRCFAAFAVRLRPDAGF